MPATVVLRTDANRHIGGGHVMRCLNLAIGLKANGASPMFASSPDTLKTLPRLEGSAIPVIELTEPESPGSLIDAIPQGCDLLVIDHYQLGADYEHALRGWAGKIAVFEDLPNRTHDCDALIDQTYGRTVGEYHGLVPDNCRILAGTEHAVLDPAFAEMRPAALSRRKQGTPVSRILVSMGLTDAADATGRVLDAIGASGLDVAVDIVLGGQAPHLEQVKSAADALPQSATVHLDSDNMADLMRDADLAFGAAGSTAWERCCLGLPSILLVTADNQRDVSTALHACGAAVLAGDVATTARAEITDAVCRIATDDALRAGMSRAAAEVCDGMGTERTVQGLLQLTT